MQVITKEDEQALIIGREILNHFHILVFSVEGHIKEDDYRGKIILSYVGKRKEVVPQ